MSNGIAAIPIGIAMPLALRGIAIGDLENCATAKLPRSTLSLRLRLSLRQDESRNDSQILAFIKINK